MRITWKARETGLLGFTPANVPNTVDLGWSWRIWISHIPVLVPVRTLITTDLGLEGPKVFVINSQTRTEHV